MAVYYNEINAHAAQWLKNLITAGLIPAGDVDGRDIREVRAGDLIGYAQCHFFAGIGGWSRALRLAGWPDDREVWTGSCPCQRFSSAARGRNNADDLWPIWQPLIGMRRPRVVFGEQVERARSWLDGLCTNMEEMDYAVRAFVIPAYSVGEDHARERIYFKGDANGHRKSVVPFDGEVARLPRHRSVPGGVVQTNGVSARMAVMRAFGNAIVPEVAAEFIKAVG